MKTLLVALSLALLYICAQARTPAEMIIGKWRPVVKAEATSTWEFKNDGVLLVKGDNGKLVVYHWQLEEPDTLIITGSPKDVTREKIILVEGNLSMKDSAGKWHSMTLANE